MMLPTLNDMGMKRERRMALNIVDNKVATTKPQVFISKPVRTCCLPQGHG